MKLTMPTPLMISCSDDTKINDLGCDLHVAFYDFFLMGWDIFDFSSETAEPNSTKLDRKQDIIILYQVRVFRATPKI